MSKREYALIAQSVEHAAVNRGVTGSSPVWGAKIQGHLYDVLLFFFVSCRFKPEPP